MNDENRNPLRLGAFSIDRTFFSVTNRAADIRI